jgi:hypothetical protein
MNAPRVPDQALDGPGLEGHGRVDWYMNKKIEIDPMITHVLSFND